MQNLIIKRVKPHETELMDQIYRLRLHVYGKECGFINEDDYPDGLETDEYDNQSIHFAAICPGGEVVGTMRMILQGKLDFPVEVKCPELSLPKSNFRNCYSEMSRLVISKDKRQKILSQNRLRAEFRRSHDHNQNSFLTHARPIAFGLCREAYRESCRRGITHWLSLMEKSLWNLLRLYGLNFNCIGNEVDFYGPVSPYVGKVTDIQKSIYMHYFPFLKPSSFSQGISDLSEDLVSV